MNTLLVTTLTGLKPQIDQADAKVQFKDLPSCVGDKTLVAELFHSIILNALENLGTPPNSSKTGLIRIWGQYSGSRIVYHIQDNGIGIAAEEFEKIFEMFYRSDPKSTKDGLGLAIVKDIVARHNGRIWLKSTYTKGSTFSIALPAKSFQN